MCGVVAWNFIFNNVGQKVHPEFIVVELNFQRLVAKI